MDDNDKIYYNVLLEAFIQTKNRKDRSLLTLSSGGIGLLITLLTTSGVNRIIEIIFYFLSFLCFIITIILIINIFELNSMYIIDIYRNNNNSKIKIKLNRLDKYSFISFILAILFSFSIGMISAIDHFERKEKIKMSEEKKKFPDGTFKSLTELEKLRPVKPDSSKDTEKPSEKVDDKKKE